MDIRVYFYGLLLHWEVMALGKLKKVLCYSPLLIFIYIGVMRLLYIWIPDIALKAPLIPVFGDTLILLFSPKYGINYLSFLIFVPFIIVSICSIGCREKYRTFFLALFSFLMFVDTIAMLCFLFVNHGIGPLAEKGAQYSTGTLVGFCVIELLFGLATNTLIWKHCGKRLE